ncbi:hypothetical protein BC567DRAFT_64695 [Phyllosticta citribraziliensis]
MRFLSHGARGERWVDLFKSTVPFEFLGSKFDAWVCGREMLRSQRSRQIREVGKVVGFTAGQGRGLRRAQCRQKGRKHEIFQSKTKPGRSKRNQQGLASLLSFDHLMGKGSRVVFFHSTDLYDAQDEQQGTSYDGRGKEGKTSNDNALIDTTPS